MNSLVCHHREQVFRGWFHGPSCGPPPLAIRGHCAAWDLAAHDIGNRWTEMHAQPRFQGSPQFLADRFLGMLLQVGKEHVQFKFSGHLDSAHHSR